MQRLVHYSATPVTKLVPYAPPPALHPIAKPFGLWFSVEGHDDWKEWCETEGFGLERLALKPSTAQQRSRA